MDNSTQDARFLPDLCHARLVFIAVLLTELFAFVVWLINFTTWPLDWSVLGKVSMFLQWVVLVSTSLLCGLRKLDVRVSPVQYSALGMMIVIGVTATTTGFSHHFELSNLGLLSSLFRNCSVALIISGLVFHYLYLRHQKHHGILSQHQARIEALQARIRPHFLFNCLNTIAALIRHSPEAAEQTVEDLADMFRASTADVKTLVTIDEEIELIERYLRIEMVRVGDRLSVRWDIDALRNKQIKLPLLTLQPLVENAIYHGVEQIPEGGEISICGRIEDNTVMIDIKNPMPKQSRRKREGLHIAVENTRQRLQLTYNNKAELTLNEYADEYHVSLILPVKEIL